MDHVEVPLVLDRRGLSARRVASTGSAVRDRPRATWRGPAAPSVFSARALRDMLPLGVEHDGAGGVSPTLVTAKHARNCDAIKIGDLVEITYMQVLAVSLEP